MALLNENDGKDTLKSSTIFINLFPKVVNGMCLQFAWYILTRCTKFRVIIDVRWQRINIMITWFYCNKLTANKRILLNNILKQYFSNNYTETFSQSVNNVTNILLVSIKGWPLFVVSWFGQNNIKNKSFRLTGYI